MSTEHSDESGTRRASSRASHGVRLLEAEPDLVATIPESERARVVRQLVVPSVTIPRGAWQREDLAVSGVRGEVRGFLVLEGIAAVDMALAGHVCTRLLTPGELVLLDGWQAESLPVSIGWSALESTSLAVLDDRLKVIERRWPGLMMALLARSAQQIHHALLQQAIAQLPRVEDRLLALLWSVADRRGVMRSDGVWVQLPVTHAVLAQMIGARRPTVTLGLRSLAERGLMRPEDGGWLLDRSSINALSPRVRV